MAKKVVWDMMTLPDKVQDENADWIKKRNLRPVRNRQRPKPKKQ